MAREKRAKMIVKSLLGDLREKNLISEELSGKLSFYLGKKKISTLNIMYCTVHVIVTLFITPFVKLHLHSYGMTWWW